MSRFLHGLIGAFFLALGWLGTPSAVSASTVADLSTTTYTYDSAVVLPAPGDPHGGRGPPATTPNEQLLVTDAKALVGGPLRPAGDVAAAVYAYDDLVRRAQIDISGEEASGYLRARF